MYVIIVVDSHVGQKRKCTSGVYKPIDNNTITILHNKITQWIQTRVSMIVLK